MTLLVPLVVGALFQSIPAAGSAPQHLMALTRIDEPIVIDGHVDEPVWHTIEPLPTISYDPVPGLPPSEVTEIRIAYDDDNIYASIRAYDSDPSGIRMNTLYRDRLSGDDVFHILLDTYNDYESAIAFTITPSGAKRDGTVSNDGEGPDATNFDFSTFWDVATVVDERGWFAEVRIPFSSIGFQDERGRVVMGILVQRGISRKNERVTFPEAPPHTPRPFFKPSLAQRVVFEGVYSRRPLHITPFAAGGMAQEYHLLEGQTDFARKDDHRMDAGFDVKYGMTNNLTLDVTVNTDFAQVEADDQQVNLTRFNLFFPDKRQFFQERSGVFDFNTGGAGRLFHSRRIGLTGAGKPLRILAGGRLTGRIGSWDVGLLNMQTDSYRDIPLENFGVVRLRREMLNPYSYIGGMATSRIGADGTYNVAYGIDGSLRISSNDYLMWAWAQSVEDEALSASPLDASRLRLQWERRSRVGLAWQTTVSRSGKMYNPGTGFVPRLDYFRIGQILSNGWMPGPASPFLLLSLQSSGSVYWRGGNRQVESIDLGVGLDAGLKSGAGFDADISWYYEDIPIAFTLLGRTVIPSGEYRFLRGRAGYRMSSSRLLRTRVQVDAGKFYDGWRHTVSLAPTWNVSRHFELEASYLYNLVNVPAVYDWFAVHVGQLRIRTALNTHLSTNAFIQFNSSANILSTNIRFRYNFRDGNDLWIVYNEGMNTNRLRADPVLPLTDARTVLLKYTHTIHR